MQSHEELAREKIDKILADCGWVIQNRNTINLSAGRGVAIREALLKDRDQVDYLLFVDGKAIGTVEAKPEGHALTGVEEQSGKYGTATPSMRTIGFFDKNLVMEYGHERAVADQVNVNYDIYNIETEITKGGSRVEKGFYVDKRDRLTRKVRWEQLGDDLIYAENELDRGVVAPDQIRTVIRTFRDRLFTEIFPGRTVAPKTLIFAKDDSHADDIVKIVREEFGKGNDFCQKITYRTTGAKPADLIQRFRNSVDPRIAVTVDMIATGTDIKAVEIVMFMRAVKSRSFFEQMKGRGVRIIAPDDLQSVTGDAMIKDHFVIVDAVGVCEQDKTDSHPMEQKPTVSFE